MKKNLLSLAAILLCAVMPLMASGKREFRAAWLATYYTIDWPAKTGTSAAIQRQQKDLLIEYIENHKKRNFTTIMFQVRTGADAFYKSSYEPWSEYVSGSRGTSPGWDPLAFMVEECHKRGMECYAWVNPFRFRASSSQARNTAYDKDIRNKGWLISNSNGYETFNPGIPEVREHLRKVIAEIYTNYRIDGLLFDDYFYPNNIPEDETADDWNTYLKYGNGDIGDWRRENINGFMSDLYAEIMKARPDLTFGLSPAGISHNKSGFEGVGGEISGTHDWQYDEIYSDPVAWLADQSVDFISPQIYWFCIPGNNSYTTSAPYEKLVKWWTDAAKAYGRHNYVSLGSYRFADGKGNPIYNNESHWRDIDKQIKTIRNINGDDGGQIYYSAKYMDGPLCSGWGDYLQENAYQHKTLVPKITWKTPAQNLYITNLKLANNVITWDATNQTGNAPIIRYTVYAVPKKVSQQEAIGNDGVAAEYLREIVYGGSYTIPQEYSKDYWYAVCAYDNLGNESAPYLLGYDGDSDIEISKDNNIYKIDCVFVNMWYRSVKDGYDGIEFVENGNGNRGLAISGQSVYMSSRTDNTENAVTKLVEYDLYSGVYRGEHILKLTPSAYMCNDVIADNNERLYITNLVLNIKTSPLLLHSFDPATGQVKLLASLKLSTPLPTTRVDHVTVHDAGNGKLHVYAAMSSGTYVVRWTVENGNAVKEEVMEAKQFVPASAKNFGVAPRVCVTESNRILVNGGSIAPSEYDFTNGNLLSSAGSAAEIAPIGLIGNGVAWSSETDINTIVYSYSDTQNDGGYSFAAVANEGKGFKGAKKLCVFPKDGMGSLRPQYHTGSTPVAIKKVDNFTPVGTGGWYYYIAVLGPGNGLAVYALNHKYTASVEQIEAPGISYTILGGNAVFTSAVDHVAVYTIDGLMTASATNATSIELPSAAGIYLLVINGKAHRIAVR